MKKSFHLTLLFVCFFLLFACSESNNSSVDGDLDLSDGDLDNELEMELEAEADPCEPNPCEEENKTTCSAISAEEFECLCDDGYFDPGFGRCIEDIEENRLPESLGFEYTREPSETPLDENQLEEFSIKLGTFIKDIDYFNWLYRSSHGVDASTGKPDFLWWWSDFSMIKDGDTVTMKHKELPRGGGQNMHTDNANLMAVFLSGYMLTGDERLKMLTEQFCKGLTSTMKGMAYDENDQNDHLMTRNVVMMNHSFTTDEGYKKIVDYSGWYSPYVKWNCGRFKYANNPYWGEVWVTNMRSKDDLGRILRMAVPLRYAIVQSADSGIRETCGETYQYLQRFFKDVVDSDYYIRTKNDKGEIFVPGLAEDQDPDYNPKDASTFALYDMLGEEGGECLPKRAVALMAYGEGLDNNCGNTSWNVYDDLAIMNNPPNSRIIRANHISHIAQALIHGDLVAASDSIEGLIGRFERQKTEDISDISVAPDDWQRDIALNLMQASAYGYPLTADDVRHIHKYYLRSVENFKDWGLWNLWDESVADGEYSRTPSTYIRDEDDVKVSWIRANNLAVFMEYCWSPFKNPQGLAPVDCDVILNILR